MHAVTLRKPLGHPFNCLFRWGLFGAQPQRSLLYVVRHGAQGNLTSPSHVFPTRTLEGL